MIALRSTARSRRTAARRLAAELEARAHKQLYFVEEAPRPPGGNPRGMG
jgi:hypothetical protein